MSTGYLILFYKNILIESYIRNFLMTKYISLNNAIGANKLISKIKYYHRNYFCFINKGKNIVRCIIKLNKITNNQIDLKIKSQQELTLNELKKSEIFKNENIIIENFFNLENNSDFIYSNNKINLLIKESNNIYEFNCLLLEDSIDMGTFEKIKKCMKDKENTHTNEIQNNLRHNPLISNILNYQNLRNKNFEEFFDKKIENGMGIEDYSKSDKNENNDKFFFDMKNEKYFLFDELLVNKNDNKKLFDENKLSSYLDLTNKYQSIFEVSDNIFKKPFSELEGIDIDNFKINENKDLKIELKENNKDTNTDKNDFKNVEMKNEEINTKMDHELDNSYKKETTKDIYRNYENPKIKTNFQSRSYSYINNYNDDNYSTTKDEQKFNEGYKRYDRYDRLNRYDRYDSYNNNYYYNNNNFKRNSGNNSFSYDYTNDNNTTNDYNTNDYNNNNDNYSNNNSFNRTDYNNNNKYYYQNNDKYNYRTNNKFREPNQFKSNFYNNFDNNSSKYIYRRNDRYNNMNNDYYRNNNYNHSYHSSNNNSFNSERKSNFSRSRDKSPIQSPNQYSNYDSPRKKSYANKYNERNDYRKNNSNNYYGDNNNINYYYNINNYYRQGNSKRWNDNNNYYQREKNFQRNKSEYYNNNNNNYSNNNNNNQSQFYRDRRRENQNDEY